MRLTERAAECWIDLLQAVTRAETKALRRRFTGLNRHGAGWPIDFGPTGEIVWLEGRRARSPSARGCVKRAWREPPRLSLALRSLPLGPINDRRQTMHVFGRASAGSRLLRPVARASDGIVHNRERRKRIHRYRRVARVALATEHDDQQSVRLPVVVRP
jgi:hypothetical protein